MAKSAKRVHQVSDLIHQILVKSIQREVSDPRLLEMSITSVDVSPDLGTAKVYYSVLNDEHRSEVENALKKAVGFLRHRVSVEAKLRYTPQLRFIFDETLASAERITDLMKDVSVDDANQEKKPS